MNAVDFVELAARSSFSFLRGASHPEEMIDQAKALGLGGMALCDRDGLYGVARAHTRAREIEQRFHLGVELPLALSESEIRAGYAGALASNSDVSCRQLLRSAKPSAARKRKLIEDEYPAVVLLVRSHVGYQNLCWLLTRAHAGLPKGECLLDLDDLEGKTAGLIALIPTCVRRRPEASPNSDAVAGYDAFPEQMLSRLSASFGRYSVYSLTYRRLTRDDVLRTLLAKSRRERHGFPVLASARPMYHEPSRKRLLDVVQCIRMGMTLAEAKTRLASNGQAYLRSAAQMAKLFGDQPDWVGQTSQVASELCFRLDELVYHFPCQTPDGQTPDEWLSSLSWSGATRRYPAGVPAKVREQLIKELELIAGMGMAPYFLSTWEVVNIARERGILCQGRGSAANSAVCYVLGITAVNPEHSNLLFERFMSIERKEPPDIDVDLEHERREEVIQEIYRRYGRDRAAMVSEVICYRKKSAMREISKVFGFSVAQTDRLARAFAYWDSYGSVSAAQESAASDVKRRVRQAELDISTPKLEAVLDLTRLLVGFPRHLSIHVGGFVLSSRPLFEVAPVEPARMADRSVIPWDKDDLDTLGFFKIDVLALGMLTAIRKALQLAWPTLAPGEPFDPLEAITRIPDEDPAVYALTARADTVGVFQIESRAQMAMLPRLRPRSFYDLVIEVAIVRPGPIQGGMVHPYLRRRNHEEAPNCHPRLQSILDRTLGVPLFQEQVMQIAIVGAGYSGGEADQLRRDMAAWKKTGRLMRHRERLLQGFARHGIDRGFGEALFEQIKGFGEYGFPESHAASFALLVYKSAWLKAHRPAEFLCGLLNSQPMGFYSPASLVKDAQNHGVEVRPACIAQSDWDCTLEGAAVRLGFSRIKGLSQASAESVLERRRHLQAQGGQLADLADFIRQVPLPKGDFEALAEAGAFAALEPARRQVLWSARAPRQLGLFHGLRADEPRAALPELAPIEVLELDYARLRLSIDDHPLCHLRERLQRDAVLTTEKLAQQPQGARVAVAGLVTARQRPGTASGVVFVTIEDETGIANLIFYSRVFDAYRMAAQHSPLLLVRGKVERQDPKPGSVNRRDPREANGVASIVHLVVDSAERLTMPQVHLSHSSRDFR